MQTPQWLPGAGLVRRLLDEPWRFQFVQAVRILDCWLGRGDASRLDPRIQFRNRISLRFPQSEIDAITIESYMPIDTVEQLEQARQAGAIGRIHVTAAIVSLLGSTGQMPYAFTRRVLATQENGRIEGVRAFFDMLSQRTVELFYEARLQARVQCAIDRQGRDGFLPMPLAVAGALPVPGPVTLHGTAGHKHDEPLVADEVAAYYAAILCRRCTSAMALQGLLTDYFGLPFLVQPFVTEMYRLRPEELSLLGRQNCILGRGLTLGSRQPLRGRRVRLRIGPMSRTDFEYFLPEARGARALVAFLRLFKLDGMPFEVQLVLRAQDVIPMQLGRGHKLGHGYTLGPQVPARDFDQYCYEMALS